MVNSSLGTVHASAHLTHTVWWSPTNLLALGTGLAFAGGLVLALGLMARPKVLATRISGSGNTSAHQNVRAAQDRTDALVGVGALVVGFAVQGASIIWGLGYTSDGPYSTLSYVVIVVLFLIPVPFVLLLDHYVKPWQVRRYLVEVAHYPNQSDIRQDTANIYELRRYGHVLMNGWEPKPDEVDEDYAKRVWHIQKFRMY